MTSRQSIERWLWTNELEPESFDSVAIIRELLTELDKAQGLRLACKDGPGCKDAWPDRPCCGMTVPTL